MNQLTSSRKIALVSIFLLILTTACSVFASANLDTNHTVPKSSILSPGLLPSTGTCSNTTRGEPILEWGLRLCQNGDYEYFGMYRITPILERGMIVALIGENDSDSSYNWEMKYTGPFPRLSKQEARAIVLNCSNETQLGQGRLVYVCQQLYWAFSVANSSGEIENEMFVEIPDKNATAIEPSEVVQTKETMLTKLVKNIERDPIYPAGNSPPSSYTQMVGQVPFFWQGNRPWCGVFSLKEVFWYWGMEDVDEFAIANYFGGAPNGLYPCQVEDGFQHWNFRFHWHGDGKSIWDSGTSYTTDDLKGDVAMGWPTIIEIRHDETGGNGDHFVSVVGYDENRVCLLDTAPWLGLQGYDIWVSYNTLELHWNVDSWDWPPWQLPHTHRHTIIVGYPGDQLYAHSSVDLNGLPSEVEYGGIYELQLPLTEDGSDAGSARYSWAQGVFLRLSGAELVSADSGGFKSYQAYDDSGNKIPISGARIIEFYTDFPLRSATIYAYATIKATGNVAAMYRGWITDEDDMTHCTVHTHTIHDDRPAAWTIHNAELVIDRKPNDVQNDRSNFLDYPTFQKQAPLKGLASSTISVSVNPSQIVLGGGTTISGTISSSVSGDFSGTVYLQYSIDNTNWNNIGSTSSDSSGAYSYWWAPSSKGTFYVRSFWNGNTKYRGATSSSVTLSVVSGAGNLGDHTMCENVQSNSPYDPIQRTNTFYTDDYAAFSWLHFNGPIYGSHTVRWDWYDPDGWNWISSSYTIPDAKDYGYDYWDWYRCWSGVYINGYQAWYASRLGRSFQTKVYYDGSWVVTETWQVIKHGSSISVSLSSSTISYGQSVTVSSQLSSSFSDGTTTLQYSTDGINWNNIASGTPSNGYFSSSWTPPSATTYNVRSTWSGNLNYYGCMSSTQALTVNRASTSIATSLSSATITYGSSATITASMSPMLQGKSVVIQFSLDDSTWYFLNSGITNSAGQYSYAWTPDAGSYYLRSTWSGDANYNGATSPNQQLTVNRASTSTVCSLSTGSINYGESVTITGTVSVSVSDGTMILEYSTDGTNWNLISSSTPSSGSYSYAWIPTGCGTFSIRATWSGSNNYQGSTSSTQTLTVAGASALVVRGKDNRIYYRLYNCSSKTWNPWMVLSSGATCDSPAAALCHNELHIVVRGTDGRSLWHGYVNLTDNTFIGWTRLSGWTPSAPSLTSNGTVLCLVVRGGDNRIYYRTYSFSPRGWGNWNVIPTGATCDSPAAAMLGNNLHIAVRGFSATSVYGNYSLWHIIVNPNAGVVRGWISMSGYTSSKPTLAANQTANKLFLAVRGLDNRIHWRTYNAGGDSWGSWVALPTGSTCDGPAATVVDNKLNFVVRGSDGSTLWHRYYDFSTATYSDWKKLSGSTPAPPTLTS